MQGFSLTTELIETIFKVAKPLGHNEKSSNLNLGFGFIYYAVVRATGPKHTVVIGSGYGFSVVERGGIFGMIRIGSQVDLITSVTESMHVKVKPGDKIRAGETVLIA